MIASTYKAPWGRLLIITSLVSTLVVLIASAALMTKAGLGGVGMWPRVVAWLPLLILFSTVPFVIRGYRVRDGVLFVDRLFWATRISLSDLQTVEVIPNAMKGGLRLCGNGGMFSFTGWWWSSRLGHYRPYVTDLTRTVVLKFPRRTVVVSPENPEEFARELAGLVTSQESSKPGVA